MTSEDSGISDASDFRHRAEKQARKSGTRPPDNSEALSPEDIRRTLHELRVHQIELEMQNEELRRTQVELDAARARYFDLYDMAPVGYCTISETGLILEANLTAASLLGMSRGILVKQLITHSIFTEDQDQYYFHRKQLFESGEPQVCELRMVKHNGALFWARMEATVAPDADGVPLGRVVFMDITERKQAEEVLRQFKMIFDSANFGAAVADLNGRLTYVNEYFAAVQGYQAKELAGKSLQEIYKEHQRGQWESLLRKLTGEGSFTAQEVEHCRRDGTAFPLLMTGQVVKEASGAPQYMVITAIDLTSRKTVENQLSHAQKMESVGRLAGGVAHDFNNMLGVILGHTDMALTQEDLASPLRSDLLAIRKAAERSALFTRQLLAFARKQTIVPKVLDLNEMVEAMLTTLRRLIGEGIELLWRPGERLWPVKMDPSQIDQILVRLCLNARDAIRGAGTITLETGIAALDQLNCAEQPGLIPGEYVRLSVSDDGCGMDKDTLDNVFEPFSTTKDLSAGVGLRLPTVYGIVKQNDGFINVYSEPGRGTTFTIYLRWYLGKTGELQATRRTNTRTRAHETVLLVEDEPGVLSLTTMMLQSQGYTVLAASTADQALGLARDNLGRIDLLLTDVVMPEMNGRKLADHLLPDHPKMKILFMSGYTANVMTQQGVLEEGVHLIEKPFAVKEFRKKVREVLDSRG